MRTLGEIEATICEGVSRFEKNHMDRGPKDSHADLLGDLLVVRLQSMLTAGRPATGSAGSSGVADEHVALPAPRVGVATVYEPPPTFQEV